MNRFRKDITNSFKLKLFFLSKLPMAFLARLRVLRFDDKGADVRVSSGWLNNNPFKSMFWAVQGMAAEFSTGILVSERVALAKPDKISMLVLNMEAEFTKKAVGKIIFTCDEAEKLDSVFEEALRTGEGQTVVLHSTGVDSEGNEVSHFKFNWTIKKKASS